MIKDNKKGISLIVLVITIVVIIILAGAVIMTLTNNNPIEMASKAKFLNNVRGYETELQLYQQKEYSDTLGGYNPNVLQADANSVTYNGHTIDDKTIYDILPSLNKDDEYKDKFIILDGELVYSGVGDREKGWLDAIDVKTSTAEPIANISEPLINPTKKEVKYIINFSSNYPLSKMNLNNNIKIVNESNIELSVQPVVTIGQLSGIDLDKTRNVEITIDTSTLGEELYKLKIKAGAIKNSNDIFNTQDIISSSSFYADNLAPVNPSISVEPTSWTNGKVTVTIIYTADSSIREYSLDGSSWQAYTSSIEVTDNNTTVYARATDNVGNQSGQSTVTIANIDKIAPTIEFSTNGSNDIKEATTIVTLEDAGGSSIDPDSLIYIWDIQNTIEPTAGWNTFTNGQPLTKNSETGTYYLWIKGSDNAGNTVVAKSNAFGIDNTAPINPSMVANPTIWTNSNVTVTITYPVDAVTKEYSIDGTTWNAYTVPVSVSINNTTVYARATDAAGNQSGQSTLTVANIDKTAPTVTASNGGTTTSSITVNAVASDAGGSGLNTSSYQYSKDNGVTWTAATNATGYTFSSLTTGTYQCKIRVTDNAGNITVSNAISISTTAIGTISIVASPTAWTIGNVSVTITYPSEIVTKQYSLDGSNWYAYSSALTITTNATVYARGYDAGNNQTAQASITVSNIDKAAPTISVTYKKEDGSTYVSDTWTNQSVTLTATGNDNGGSGVNRYQVTYEGATFYDVAGNAVTISTTTRTGIWMRAIDNVGNIGNLSPNFIVSVDKTAPIISLSQAPNGNYYKTITANIADNESGIMIRKWARGSQSAAYFATGGNVFTTPTFDVSDNDVYTVYAKNNAGSETIQTINVTGLWFLKTYTGISGIAYMSGATCDSNGVITLPASSGATQYGPYQTLGVGTYQITVTGENVNMGQLHTYYGHPEYGYGIDISRTIVTNTSNLLVYTISVPSTMPSYESVIYNYSTYVIKVNSLEIKQIS